MDSQPYSSGLSRRQAELRRRHGLADKDERGDQLSQHRHDRAGRECCPEPDRAPAGGDSDDGDYREHDHDVAGDDQGRVRERVPLRYRLAYPGRRAERVAVPRRRERDHRPDSSDDDHDERHRVVASRAAEPAGRADPECHYRAGRAGEPAQQAEHKPEASAGRVPAIGYRSADVSQEQAERHRAQSCREQCPGPEPGRAEEDEDGARRPDCEVDRVRNQVRGLLGEAGACHVVTEEPDYAECDADSQQHGGDQRPATGTDGADGAAAGAAAEAAAAAGWVTAVMVPGASMEANRVHAAAQPSGVLCHHSSGCECGAATSQIP